MAGIVVVGTTGLVIYEADSISEPYNEPIKDTGVLISIDRDRDGGEVYASLRTTDNLMTSAFPLAENEQKFVDLTFAKLTGISIVRHGKKIER